MSVCTGMHACLCSDAPEVSLKLMVNDDDDDDDDDNVVISEHDSVLFSCSSIASPPVHAWK